MNYIDVTPDPASSAARATANTAPTWDSWASSTASTLRSIASHSKDSVVTTAFETFLDDVDPRVKSLSALAERQGVNLGSAVQSAIDGDHTTAQEQQGAYSSASGNAPMISRPLNAPGVTQ